MKKTILLLLVFCAALMANAQAQNDEPTAILQHGDQATVYTGVNAFQLAYNAAGIGDVITLSAGTFNVQTSLIKKRLTIFGAGFEEDESTGTSRTILNGTLNLADYDQVLEGLYVVGDIVTYYNQTYSNLTINRCYVNGNMITYGIKDSQINQCYFDGAIKGAGSSIVATNFKVSNSNFSWIGNSGSAASVYIDHCLVREAANSTNDAYTFTNCIFTGSGTYTGDGSLMTNCIYVNEANVNPQATLTNCYQVDLDDIFADGENADYSVERTYQLQQPNVWVGTDGTPIGPSGGLGWIKYPHTPVVKDLQLNVEGVTLNINYEAEPR